MQEKVAVALTVAFPVELAFAFLVRERGWGWMAVAGGGKVGSMIGAARCNTAWPGLPPPHALS